MLAQLKFKQGVSKLTIKKQLTKLTGMWLYY